jgi:hypothetical protein
MERFLTPPDECIVNYTITIVQYLTPEGGLAYQLLLSGLPEGHGTHCDVVGLLTTALHDFLHDARRIADQ